MPRLIRFLVVPAIGLFAGASAVAACPTTSGAAHENVSSRAEPVSQECLVSWGRVPTSVLLVDVRTEPQRSSASVRGASSMALASSALAESTAGSMVLIGDGLNQLELLARCAALTKRGVNVAVLDGGVLSVPAPGLQVHEPGSLHQVEPQAAVEALRSDPAIQLILVGTEVVSGLELRHAHVGLQPDAASVRHWAAHRGAVVLAGPVGAASAWRSALVGAGGQRVFRLNGSIEDLIAIDTNLNELHKGRHWVPPTPCERQS